MDIRALSIWGKELRYQYRNGIWTYLPLDRIISTASSTFRLRASSEANIRSNWADASSSSIPVILLANAWNIFCFFSWKARKNQLWFHYSSSHEAHRLEGLNSGIKPRPELLPMWTEMFVRDGTTCTSEVTGCIAGHVEGPGIIGKHPFQNPLATASGRVAGVVVDGGTRWRPLSIPSLLLQFPLASSQPLLQICNGYGVTRMQERRTEGRTGLNLLYCKALLPTMQLSKFGIFSVERRAWPMAV